MKYITIILICLLLVGCKEKTYTEIPDEIKIETINTVEVHSNTYLYDLIKFENAEILSDNYRISTSTLGTSDLEIFYRYNKKKHVYNLKLTIEDTTLPKILGSTIRTIQLNHSDDLCNLIMYGDNHDRNPKCIIEGSYDVKKTGSYDLKYIITDSSNNKSEHNLVLHVVKPSNNTTSSTKSTLAFSDILDKYQNDRAEVGIDVSKWQQNIDFNKVKAAGATFVMMRIGVQRYVGAELELDEYYLQNIKKAKEAGLKVGVYFYSIAVNKEESIKQAKWVIEKLNGTKLDLPIVFDWESWSWWNLMELSFYDINDIADSFLDTITENGYKAMLYGSKYYLENIWENNKDYPVWLAHYTNETNYNGEYIMWQLSDSGTIPGVNGNVDLNILYNH